MKPSADHGRELLLPTRDRLLAVEGLGSGGVNVAMLSGLPSFTSLSISPSCHNGERSRGVVVQRFFTVKLAQIVGTLQRVEP